MKTLIYVHLTSEALGLRFIAVCCGLAQVNFTHIPQGSQSSTFFPHYWSFVRGTTRDRWIHKGSVMRSFDIFLCC